MLELRTLGQFLCQYDDRTIEVPSRPAQSLLSYLCLSAGISHRREKLAGMLWPNATEENARSYLRMALWRIRKSFGESQANWESYLEIDDISVRFIKGSNHWLDADNVLERKEPSAWSRDGLIRAVSAYQGELLPGFYDEWTVLERERLRAAYDHKMNVLLDQLIEEQQWDDVLDWSEGWIALGLVPEPAYRALMIAHAGFGDLASVSAVYRRFENALRQELGVGLSDDVQELYEQLQQGQKPSVMLTLSDQDAWSLEAIPPAPGDPPYLGLRYFDVTDTKLFFGREEMVDRLIQHLQSSSLVAVVGASGSGKSSVVRAGLIPNMIRDKQAASPAGGEKGNGGIAVYLLTPTARPLESLASNVYRDEESVSAVATLIDDLGRDNRSLYLALKRQIDRGKISGVLLVIDQLEEIFTLCRDNGERIVFIENILSAVEQAAKMPEAERMITVVLTLRADFYDRCAQFPDLRKALSRNQEYIGAMNNEELRRAIEEPAHRGGWEFQPGLVDLILRDVRGEPGALPLLSHALLETWRRRSGQALTLKGYAQAGGVRGAIAQTAERVFNHQLASNQQETARKIFLRLTEVGEISKESSVISATRRRVSLNELIFSTADTSEIQAILNTLANARLITLHADSAEVAHEALIREWPRLGRWLEEGWEALLLHRHLTVAAQDWEALDRDPGGLYRGARLVQAWEWSTKHTAELNLFEHEFLMASKVEEEREEEQVRVQQQRELESARMLAKAEQERVQEQSKMNRRLRWLAVGLSLVLLIAMISAVLAIQQRNRAEQERDRTEEALDSAEEERIRADDEALLSKSRELAATAINNLDIDPELSILLALEALSLTRTGEAENALHHALQVSRLESVLEVNSRTGAVIWGLAFSPDGSDIVIQYSNVPEMWQAVSTTQLWDIAVEEVIFSRPGVLVSNHGYDQDVFVTVGFLSPNRLLFTEHEVDGGEKVRSWELDLNQSDLELEQIERMALSSDGNNVALTMNNGLVGVWELGNESPIFLVNYGYDDGISGCFDRAGSWFANEDRELPVMDADFSPDHKRLAAAGCDGTIRIWDIASAEIDLELNGHQDRVMSVAFSPDGTRLATTSTDGTAKIWDSFTGQELTTLRGHLDGLMDAAFDPMGSRLATTSLDNSAKVWDVESGQLLFSLDGHNQRLIAPAFSSDGTRLATSSVDGTVRVWNTDPVGMGEGLTIAQSGAGDVLLLSRDGKRLTTRSENGHYIVYETESGQIKCVSLKPGEEICPVLASPDGHYLISISEVNSFKIMNNDKRELSLRFPDEVEGTAFSPDGEILAVAAVNQGINLINLPELFEGTRTDSTSLEIEPDKDSPISPYSIGPFNDLLFSPEGDRFAAATDCTFTSFGSCGVIIWDTETWEVTNVIRRPINDVYGADFSPDRRRLAIVGNDEIVVIVEMPSGDLLMTLSGHSGPILDVIYSPDGSRIATAGTDGTTRVWDAETGHELLALTGHEGPVTRVVFGPDGKSLYTAGRDGTSREYVLDLDELTTIARGRVTRSLTDEECQQFLGRESCSDSP